LWASQQEDTAKHRNNITERNGKENGKRKKIAKTKK
jgi:hypothetical protein